MPKVSKSNIESYLIRNGSDWGEIAISIREETVNVMVNSSYGHYAYYWCACGMNPKAFLCKINKGYTLQKLTHGKETEIDEDKCLDQIKQAIIDTRRTGDLTADQAREAWDGMVGVWEDRNGYDIAMGHLIDSKYFEQVFGDYEALPSARRLKPECEFFWEKIWMPFVEELKQELSMHG